jgi:hypothetical protein
MTLTRILNPGLSSPHAALAYENLILATRVGSEVHGINITGTDDHDEMGVYVEPPSIVLGLDQLLHGWEQPGLDDVIERTRAEGERSQPGDTDRTLYSLRKYLRLAVQGNPTVLLPLFAPQTDVLYSTVLGATLRAHRHLFLSQEAAWRFVGFSRQQYERMMGRGRRSSVPNRPELIERYGWDVKYGSHALRLAYQCEELVSTGTLTLPMREPERSRVMHVKTGGRTRDPVALEVSSIIDDLEHRLRDGTTVLPKRPPLAELSAWAVEAHLLWWRERGL